MNNAKTIETDAGGYREVLRVASPLIVSMASFTVMQFCDRMFLAWYNAVSIQAALPAGILSFTLLSGFMALAGYAGTFVAQYHGAGDRLGCSRATAQGIYLSLLVWPLLWLLIPVGVGVLHLSGHTPPVMKEEVTYFTILMMGGITVPLGAAVSGFFTGRGDTMTNMLATLASNLVNVVLDYLMIFGKCGFPAMGIAGAAWATVISGFVSPALLLVLYFSGKIDDEYETRSHFRIDFRLMWRIMRFGVPSAVHLVLDVGSFTLFVLFTGRMGGANMVASNIAFSINNVAFMPLLGLSVAASILVGQYQGSRQSEVAEKAAWTSLKLGWMYMAFIAATFLLFPEQYFSLFTSSGVSGVNLAEVLPVGRRLLLLMAAWGLLDAINIILSGALKGAGDTRFVMVYSVVMGWVFWIGGEVILVFVFNVGLFPAWLWMAVFVGIMASGFLLRFRSGIWKRIEVLEREALSPANRPAAEAFTVGE